MKKVMLFLAVLLLCSVCASAQEGDLFTVTTSFFNYGDQVWVSETEEFQINDPSPYLMPGGEVMELLKITGQDAYFCIVDKVLVLPPGVDFTVTQVEFDDNKNLVPTEVQPAVEVYGTYITVMWQDCEDDAKLLLDFKSTGGGDVSLTNIIVFGPLGVWDDEVLDFFAKYAPQMPEFTTVGIVVAVGVILLVVLYQRKKK